MKKENHNAIPAHIKELREIRHAMAQAWAQDPQAFWSRIKAERKVWRAKYLKNRQGGTHEIMDYSSISTSKSVYRAALP